MNSCTNTSDFALKFLWYESVFNSISLATNGFLWKEQHSRLPLHSFEPAEKPYEATLTAQTKEEAENDIILIS